MRPRTGFDFTGCMTRMCRDMVERLPELAHIDFERVTVTFSQTRKAVSHGIYATLTPMRFEGGSLVTQRRGRRMTVQRLFNTSGREQLYILSFYLPRFMNTTLEEKLVTVLHELWHISPDFDGDLRRFPGRCYAHSGSQETYDREMLRLARKWLRLDPPQEIYAFLQMNFHQLKGEHGAVYGMRVRQPKLVPA